MSKLPENVFIYKEQRPTKEDANEQGYVLYYSASLGWHQAYWSNPWREDITHWTYLPEVPPRLEDRSSIMNRKFNDWADEKFPNCEAAAKMLMRLGWEAGFKTADKCP